MNEIRRILDLPATPERVWAYLTEPEKISAWLMDCNLIPTSGTQFTFTAPAAGRWDGHIHCEVMDVIPHERISYTWTANDIGATTLVTFDLEPTPTGTRLLLVHRGLENARGGAPGRHSAGWYRCLKALAAVFTAEPALYDWSELQLTWHVDAPLGDVYELWSTAAGMQRFWGDLVEAKDDQGRSRPASEEYANGDRIRIRFPTGTETALQILNLEHERFLLFSFGDDYGWVNVRFETAGQRTRIVLRHFGLQTGDALSWHLQANARGWWILNLLNIQSVLLHNHDLRIRQPGCEGCLGTLFNPGSEPRADYHDWSSFDTYLYIDATPQEVQAAWRCATGLCSFFISEMTLRDRSGAVLPGDHFATGDQYHWQWIHPFELTGEFLDVSDTAMTFSFGGNYRVSISVTAAATGSLLHLHQDGLSNDDNGRVHGSLNCRSCWIYYLVNLKSVLETGNDLRDRDPETADAISVSYNLIH